MNVSLCDVEELVCGEECDIWLRRLVLMVIQPLHSYASAHTLAVQDPLCVCHTSVSHCKPPTSVHTCRITISQAEPCGKALSASCLRVSESQCVSCWWFITGSSGQFVALKSFTEGEGFLCNHTLHSLTRNLITYKRNITLSIHSLIFGVYLKPWYLPIFSSKYFTPLPTGNFSDQHLLHFLPVCVGLLW